MYTRPTAPRAIGGVIDDAIRLYRASFRSCWPIALLSSIVTTGMSLYVLSLFPALETVRDPALMWQLFKPSALWSWLLLPGIASLLLLGAVTVSYTHLDVYKRQVPRRARTQARQYP